MEETKGLQLPTFKASSNACSERGDLVSFLVCLVVFGILAGKEGARFFGTALYVAFACRRCLETGFSDNILFPPNAPIMLGGWLDVSLNLPDLNTPRVLD